MTSNPKPSPRTGVPTGRRDELGCDLGQLTESAQVSAGAMRIYRKTAGHELTGLLETPSTERGFLVGVSLLPGHRRRITRGLDADSHAFREHDIYVRDFRDGYRAEISGAFDFMLAEVPHGWIERIGSEVTQHRVQGLVTRTATRDDILGHLMRAMIPALSEGEGGNELFLEQISTLIGLHLTSHYAGTSIRSTAQRPGLSKWQEARAKELLCDGKRMTIEEVAAECRLSVGYFIRAFRRTVGVTPYQWQLNLRIERAQNLLANSSMSLAEVATTCDFSEQTHLTRAFSKAVGVPPGLWRRQRKDA